MLKFYLNNLLVNHFFSRRYLTFITAFFVEFLTFIKTICSRDIYQLHSVRCNFIRYLSLYRNPTYDYFYTKWIKNNLLKQAQSSSVPTLLNLFISTKKCKEYQNEFKHYDLYHRVRLRYFRNPDSPKRQGDLLVLKPWVGPNEKGVILIQYNDAFLKFASLFDLSRLSARYRFILEPSTWGYQDVCFLLFHGLSTDVIVEAQYEPDFEYIKSFQSNLKPIRLGAGDWIDFNLFDGKSDGGKKYDIVMVASWQKLKRHELLFAAISQISDKINGVSLIGYPAGGRSLADIKKKAVNYGIHPLIDYFEIISPSDVSKLISRSKMSVMLSKREGANKGIYESFFCNVPVILTDCNVGVNRDHINEQTGIISRDHDLAENILKLLDNFDTFSPRKWAMENTGYRNSTKTLNNFLQQLALAAGEQWTQNIFPKKNCTNAMYVYDKDRLSADHEFSKIEKFLRA